MCEGSVWLEQYLPDLTLSPTQRDSVVGSAD